MPPAPNPIDDFEDYYAWKLTQVCPATSVTTKCFRLTREEISKNTTLQQKFLDPNFNHRLQTELCRDFLVHGYCAHGESCWFAHCFEQLKPSLRKKNYKTIACSRFHKNGVCPYDLRCQFVHTISADEMLKLEFSICDILNNQVPAIPTHSSSKQEQDQEKGFNGNSNSTSNMQPTPYRNAYLPYYAQFITEPQQPSQQTPQEPFQILPSTPEIDIAAAESIIRGTLPKFVPQPPKQQAKVAQAPPPPEKLVSFFPISRDSKSFLSSRSSFPFQSKLGFGLFAQDTQQKDQVIEDLPMSDVVKQLESLLS